MRDKEGGEKSAGKGRIKIGVVGAKIIELALQEVLNSLKAIGWNGEQKGLLMH